MTTPDAQAPTTDRELPVGVEQDQLGAVGDRHRRAAVLARIARLAEQQERARGDRPGRRPPRRSTRVARCSCDRSSGSEARFASSIHSRPRSSPVGFTRSSSIDDLARRAEPARRGDPGGASTGDASAIASRRRVRAGVPARQLGRLGGQRVGARAASIAGRRLPADPPAPPAPRDAVAASVPATAASRTTTRTSVPPALPAPVILSSACRAVTGPGVQPAATSSPARPSDRSPSCHVAVACAGLRRGAAVARLRQRRRCRSSVLYASVSRCDRSVAARCFSVDPALRSGWYLRIRRRYERLTVSQIGAGRHLQRGVGLADRLVAGGRAARRRRRRAAWPGARACPAGGLLDLLARLPPPLDLLGQLRVGHRRVLGAVAPACRSSSSSSPSTRAALSSSEFSSERARSMRRLPMLISRRASPWS